ncbi:MAG: hypothetical protein RJA98_522 [Pseudomonadota bacterium]|jgi:hypothetical protein
MPIVIEHLDVVTSEPPPPVAPAATASAQPAGALLTRRLAEHTEQQLRLLAERIERLIAD